MVGERFDDDSEGKDGGGRDGGYRDGDPAL